MSAQSSALDWFSRRASPVRSVVAVFALHDVIFLAYLAIFWSLLMAVPPQPAAAGQLASIYVRVAVLVLACVVVRRGTQPGSFQGVLYRGVLAGTALANYATLRETLPLLRPDAVDEALMGIDRALFGTEPVLWMERLNTPPLVEYFSFFYLSYFWLCLVMAVVVFGAARQGIATAEFSIGTALVYCVGQLGYVAVPGYGPTHAFADRFLGPVDGGLLWRAVSETVSAGGAMKDVFPSLHTAGPVWFALYAVRRAATEPRWRMPSAALGFFAANIIVSTLVLRWHYAVDVIAGVALAVAASRLAPVLARSEESLRRLLGLPGVW